MNMQELKLVLPVLMQNNIVPFIWGTKGIGKTQGVKQLISGDMGFVHLHLATQEVGDLVGLLKHNPDGSVSHSRPQWMPTSGRGIIFLDECLIGTSQIVTDKGLRSISSIYEGIQDQEEIFVKSFNEKTKTFEFKKITYAWNKGKKEVIGLRFNTTKIVTCTKNHPILTNNGYKAASDLVYGDKIIASVESKEKTATPALGEDQLQVAYGSILGDGSLVYRINRTRLLRIIHGKKQKEYCEYKAGIFQTNPRLIEKNGYAQTPAYTFHTRLLTEFYNMTKSEAIRYSLDNIDSRGLAVWYQDDGSTSIKGNCAVGTIHTEGWKLSDIEYAVNTLNEKGYKCKVQKSNKADGRKFNVIYIGAEGFKLFSRDIAEFVHPTMRYKVRPEDRHIEFKPMSNKYLDYGFFIFTKFCKPSLYSRHGDRQYVYDIEIEDNHNFIVASRNVANGIVVHNCNRLSPDVMQCMFSFILDKTIHTHKLPDGWSIVAAGNYDNNNYQVTNLGDDAFMSRFCHIDFKPTKEEFINYMESKDQDIIASFARNQPEMIEVNKKEDKLDLMKIATPDRRKFDTMIAPLEEESSIDGVRYEVYSGIIGPSATAAFVVHKQKQEERLSGKQVLNKYSTLRSKVANASSSKDGSVRLDYLNGAVEEILAYVGDNNTSLSLSQIDNLKSFLLDIPLELGLKFINGITLSKWRQKDTIINDVTFIKTFKSNKLERVK